MVELCDFTDISCRVLFFSQNDRLRLCGALNVKLHLAGFGGGRQLKRFVSRGSDMSAFKIAFVACFLAAVSCGTVTEAYARGRLFPLTMCGPNLSYLCPIHGYFDLTPFHYSLAVYPGCIQVRPVETPNGIRLRRVLVCG